MPFADPTRTSFRKCTADVLGTANGPALQRRGRRRAIVTHLRCADAAGHVRCKRKLDDAVFAKPLRGLNVQLPNAEFAEFANKTANLRFVPEVTYRAAILRDRVVQILKSGQVSLIRKSYVVPKVRLLGISMCF